MVASEQNSDCSSDSLKHIAYLPIPLRAWETMKRIGRNCIKKDLFKCEQKDLLKAKEVCDSRFHPLFLLGNLRQLECFTGFSRKENKTDNLLDSPLPSRRWMTVLGQ